MLRGAIVCAILLAAPPVHAEEPDDARREVRAAIDHLMATTATMAYRSTIPSNCADITTQVNALLAMPEEEVIDALLDANLRAEERGSVRHSSRVKSLAVLLTGAEPCGCGWWMGPVFRELHGVVVVHAPRLPQMVRNAHSMRVRIAADARLRRPFRPRVRALLDDVLAGDPKVLAITREYPGSEVIGALAAPIGIAGRTDPTLARRLLEALRDRMRRPKRDIAEQVCWRAVGFLGGEAARRLLLDSLAAYAGEPMGTEDGTRGFHASYALRQMGAAPEALAVLREKAGDLPAGELRRKCATLGGDAAVRPWFKRAHRPTVAALEGLADLLNEGHAPTIPVSRRIASADLALELMAGPGEKIRLAAFSVLQTSFWAGLYGRYGYAECPNTPGDIAPGHPKAARSALYFRGGWPDPEAQDVRIREDMAAGRLAVDCDFVPSPSVFEESIEGRGPDGSAMHGARLEARRHGSTLRLSLVNAGVLPIAFNPLAFRYGSAVRWPLRGKPEGRVEVGIRVGRILPGYRCRTPRSIIRTLAPGETFETEYPLTGALHPGSRIVVDYSDRFLIDGVVDRPFVRWLQASVPGQEEDD